MAAPQLLILVLNKNHGRQPGRSFCIHYEEKGKQTFLTKSVCY
jgi:hypothetical protein